MENTLYRRKTEKVVGAGEITADSLKFMGQDSIKRIRDVANGLLEGLKMQEYWRKSDLAPLDKQKQGRRLRACGRAWHARTFDCTQHMQARVS